ncbi:recombinase family protein [Streptomyces sp. AP-93]|uniref:recombinase family protein n=1 Tax=Streptomyces sp. AP-93 TaxID=2929048 RepID=UPI001FB00550|nr:recombinase family protein [Streptomyces sp. AP-93]MCJ0872374.1 recombinase family protein [Streptomyces sp. AP-93]
MAKPLVDLLVRKSQVVREGELALTLRAQEDRGRRWAQEHGYEVREVWKENLSAWSDIERPKQDAAMSAVIAGEVSALWCFALDRFSRKGAESVIPLLGKARVIFDYEQLDSSNERDRQWILQRSEDARAYSQRLSHNVRATKARQRSEGRWLSKAPFGLKVDEARKLRPDTEGFAGADYSPWELVMRIFTDIADGVSCRALARTFNAEGVADITGRTWHAGAVRKIVIHPVYEGWLAINPKKTDPVAYLNESGDRVRCVPDDVVPHMVSTELAARARQVLSGHLLMDGTPVPGRASALLAGRLTCEGCGRSMLASGNSYVCQANHSGAECAARASVSRVTLEKYVTARWLARMSASDPEGPLMSTVAGRWTALHRPTETQALREARAAVSEAEATLGRFHADDRTGFYAGRSARYRMPAKTDAENRLTEAEERLAALDTERVDITFLLDGYLDHYWQTAGPALRRELIATAIDRIHVSKAPGRGVRLTDDRVRIVWASGDDE